MNGRIHSIAREVGLDQFSATQGIVPLDPCDGPLLWTMTFQQFLSSFTIE